MRQRIAACLIVQDEEARLPHALSSVAFCDEVIVVDGGSRDHTVEIATAAGAMVIENPWPGYAAQRNVALDAATAEWILEVDADERVTPQLAASIRAFVDAPADVDAAVCSLRNRFLGQMLGPSAKYPQYRIRLFARQSYRHDEQKPVHEGIVADGRYAVLEGDLEHELADSWTEALYDTLQYARLQASHITPPRSPRAYLAGILLRPLAKFAYRLILEGGWHDGPRGALKVTLDCASDSLVWTLLLLRAARGDGDGTIVSADGHFGRTWSSLRGPVKIVAVVAGERPTKDAAQWLAEAQAAGALVALVTDQPGREIAGVRLRPVTRRDPLTLLRALEAEAQLLAADAIVTHGPRAGLAVRLLPRHLRGAVDGISLATGPVEAEAIVRAAVRDS